MKHVLMILPSFAAFLLIGCNLLHERAEVVEHQTVDFEGIAKVRIETSNGAVDVDGDEHQTDIDLHITRFARGRTLEEARENVAAISVNVDRDPPDSPLLTVTVDVPRALRHASAGAHLDVSLPRRVDLEIRTSNGRVEVTGTEGRVDAVTSNGRIDVVQVNGDVAARTSNGSITVRDVVGSAELGSSNGRVTLERVEAETIVATTTNGRIEATDVSGSATLETSNGSIDLRAASLPDRPGLKARTSNGSVYIEVPSTVNARLNLRSSNGPVHQHLRGVEITDYEQSNRQIEATLNEGGGNIEISTSNGSITFRTSGG